MLGSGMSPIVLTVAADTEIDASRGYLHGVTIRAAAAAGIVTLYDGPIANGKILASIGAPINGFASVIFQRPIGYTTLRSAVTGAGVVGIAYNSK